MPNSPSFHRNSPHQVNLVVGVAHRNRVRVLEVVFDSIAWGIICSAWGACIARVVSDNLDLHQLLRYLHPTTELRLLHDALLEQSTISEVDLLVSTCNTSTDLHKIYTIIKISDPSIVLLGIRTGTSRKEVLLSLNFQDLKTSYSLRLSSLEHTAVGGGTQSLWCFAVLVSLQLKWNPPSERLNRYLFFNNFF
jgi:hypothetical protein